MVVMWLDVGGLINAPPGDMVVLQRCLSHRRLLAGMYNAEGDRVNCNTPIRAFPKFAYDQRKARRR
jgi:hypothetical protein